MSQRLTTSDGLPDSVACPRYQRDAHGAGIVHIGLGAFHKAHQAAYTDDALGASGGDWRIIGVSLRSEKVSSELKPQNALYTLIERDAAGTRARVIGALYDALSLRTERDAVLKALTAPATRIVPITVTEKGYGIDRTTGGVDRNHPAIAADLAAPQAPQGLAGLLVWALNQRRMAGVAPFTVLSCDNLPDNGPMLRSLLVDFARYAMPDMVDHISQKVAFPASMVDRITPAQNDETRALASNMTGRVDEAAIETEGFRQWVIEDDFPTGRPDWEAGGALFVPDVRPYENMKLRMLNGTHSMLAYAGFLAGHRYVRDVMADDDLAEMVRRHFRAAAATLEPLKGVDFSEYAGELEDRFRNPHLAHETYQIAMDGSQKMQQRIFEPAVESLTKGLSIDAFAFATASWIRYTFGKKDTGELFDLRDPRKAELKPIDALDDPQTIVQNRLALPGLCPPLLRDNVVWQQAVSTHLTSFMRNGVRETIRKLAV